MRARDANVGAHSLSPMYNIRPLNSPASTKFTYALHIYHDCRLMFRPVCTSIGPTPPLFYVELEKTVGIGGHALLWCQGAQNIELSTHKLKSALKYTV